MRFQHPMDLWENPTFMEEVRQQTSDKYQKAPDHYRAFCRYLKAATENARVTAPLDNEHDETYLILSWVFALGYEAAIHNIAIREHEA